MSGAGKAEFPRTSTRIHLIRHDTNVGNKMSPHSVELLDDFMKLSEKSLIKLEDPKEITQVYIHA